MLNTQATLTLGIFFLTILFLVWRPGGLNESIPTTIGAVFIFLFGMVAPIDIYKILGVVTGASITIISTIIMSIVLESIGFFRWAAFNLATKANGSGIVLYWYIISLCFLMTLFFNNDGSILITTPIIIEIVTILNLTTNQKISYLFSGALIATASSAPIGVSNLANLIALKIVGLDLNTYAKIMFLPSIIGLITISLLLFFYFKKDIPKNISFFPETYIIPEPVQIKNDKPDASFFSDIKQAPIDNQTHNNHIDWQMFRICITIIVLIRVSFFTLSGLGIPLEWIAIFGAVLLIFVRWYRQGVGAYDIVKKTPWYILLFAFSMYVIIYGLHNVGFTSLLVCQLRESVASHHLNAIFIIGILLTVMSNLFNNLPSVMIGTLSLTKMDLEPHTLQVAYLANIIGSDIGSLLLPMGTLASLIWMFILKKNNIPITWCQYLRITVLIIPIGLLVSLLSLYLWTEWLY